MTYFKPKYVAKETKEFGWENYLWVLLLIYCLLLIEVMILTTMMMEGQIWVSTVYKAGETEEGGRRKIVRLHCNWVIKQSKMPGSYMSSLRCLIKKHILNFFAFNHIFKTSFCLCFVSIGWLTLRSIKLTS